MELLAAAYPWVKAAHIVFVISWMAGLLYLPRLLVYHSAVPPLSRRAAMLSTMEYRLLRFIMLPAAVLTYLFGILLAITPDIVAWQRGWLWSKLALVLGLTIFHWALGRWQRAFASGRYPHSERFFRIANELPTLAMILIVVLVVAKPF